MKIIAMAIAASAVLAGCASQATRDSLQIQDPTVLEEGLRASQSEQAGAATDAWVGAYPASVGRAQLDDEQHRLQALGAKQAGYFGAKAQCWIYAAREEHAQYNHWGFVEEAAHQADQLIGALEGRGQASVENPKLRTAAIVRPDLWQRLMAAKSSPAFASCQPAQERVACAEVELTHAGHEAWTHSFDASAQRVAEVQQKIADLPAVLNACQPPRKEPPPLPSSITLPTDTLFRFDRGDLNGLLPQGRASLDALARDLAAAGDVTAVRTEGYTDRLGSDSYNMRLSRQRAETVAGYLRERREANIAMSAVGRGKANPVVQCNERDREALIACLAPNRRVELSIARKSSGAQAAAR
ncbi:OmpA family protein [Paraburkholderia tropica]|uniref:OmpA family protein n=1 Tax=Paraburkholderia tropica TaxID=92647 RepID=UPI001F3A290A|nr:OmpA family protein [Paraburkholderia tropica]